MSNIKQKFEDMKKQIKESMANLEQMLEDLKSMEDPLVDEKKKSKLDEAREYFKEALNCNIFNDKYPTLEIGQRLYEQAIKEKDEIINEMKCCSICYYEPDDRKCPDCDDNQSGFEKNY